MGKFYIILILITGAFITDAQAANITGSPVHTNQEMWSEPLEFFEISDCFGYSGSEIPIEGIENTSPTAKSFYPANSLNVLKKALYAFEEQFSDLSLAG